MNALTDTQKLALACFAHPKHLDKLVKDKNVGIREVVAKHGTDKHRDILVHDEDPDVRRVVAWHGNEHHAKALLNDQKYQVSYAAERRLKQLGVEP